MPIEQKEEPRPRSEPSDNQIPNYFMGKTEKTFSESSLYPNSQKRPYNPDRLWEKDNTYGIYEEMLNDDQVSVSFQLKKDMIIGSGWRIEDDIDEEICKGLSEYPEDPFEDMIESIVHSSLGYGFSVSEPLFGVMDDGYLCLKNLKTRHPATWLIHTDEHGNIEEFEQIGTKNKSIKIRPGKLIHVVNNKQFQNPYGRSDLRSCHDAWLIKNHIIRFYSIFLEKNASPFPVARYSTGAPAAAVDAIFQAIKSIQQKSAIVVPKEIELELMEAKSHGEAYTVGINMFNMFIGRSLLIPDLLGFQGGETDGGSYNLGKNQMSVFFKHIRRKRQAIETIINNHIIKPIVYYNYGMVEDFPKFKFNEVDDTDAVEFAKLFLEATKGKAYVPTDDEINHFRNLIRFPEGPIERVEEPVMGADGKPVDPKDPKAKDAEKEGEEAEEQEAKVFKYKNTKGDYYKRVDFKASGRRMEESVSRIRDQSIPLVDNIYQDLYDQIERKKILKNQAIDKIETLKVKNLSGLKTILKAQLRDVYKEGKEQAKGEVFSNKFALPLPDDEFLNFLESEAFQFIGDWEYKLRQNVRLKLIEAIKDGRPLSAVISELDFDGKRLSNDSIERYSRTKATEVFNRGRIAVFEKSGIVTGYQYSAILDDRTTAICSGLHGKIFQAGKQPVPPTHWNCRSLLIPLTKFDEFTPDTHVGKQTINSFIEDNKGEGFAKQ